MQKSVGVVERFNLSEIKKYGSVIARNIRLNNSDSKRLRIFGDIGWSLSQNRMLDIKAE